jgi:FKBP-type peptidyl-prolyl cis-trans isomerase FkpA
MLRDYFMNKRGARMRAIAEKRAEADSIRLAGGDSTKVEYPAADPEMFESEEEREQISYAFGNDIGYNIAQSGMPRAPSRTPLSTALKSNGISFIS